MKIKILFSITAGAIVTSTLIFAPCFGFTAIAQKPADPAPKAADSTSSHAAPATSDSPVTTIKAQVREVVLPVTVRDKKGQIVATLKADDFVLDQDGRPEKIKSFAHETNLPFRLGLLVDTSRSEESALPSEKTASGKFVDQMLAQPVDKAFLLHFDHDVELLQDFTSAKARLHKELDEMQTSTSSGSDRGHGGDSGGGDSGNGKDSGKDAGQNGGGRRRGGGTQLYDAIYLASNELMLKEPGRKALIVLSDGDDRGSKETLNDAVDAAEKANVSVYTVYFKGSEERGESQGMGRGGMGGGGMGGGGYPGHRGGMPRPGSGEARTDGKKILEQIAKRTGGIPFEAKKKDSFDEVYAQIAEELRGQYLLTYTPDKPADKDDADGFHKISLKAKDDKLVVITREGYYSQD